ASNDDARHGGGGGGDTDRRPAVPGTEGAARRCGNRQRRRRGRDAGTGRGCLAPACRRFSAACFGCRVMEGRGRFAGTAANYARYRPGYPVPLFERIVAAFRLDGTGRLLDVGCGTGKLALPLASQVAAVVGL